MASFAKALAARAQSQLAKAEELLNQADRKAGERLVKVREIAGFTPQPAATVQDSEDEIRISSSVAALLTPDERRGLSIQDSPPDSPTTASQTTCSTADGELAGGIAESVGDGTVRQASHAAAGTCSVPVPVSTGVDEGASQVSSSTGFRTSAAVHAALITPVQGTCSSAPGLTPEGGTSEDAKKMRAEWLALQHELQIINMHGRKLQTRLEKQKTQLERSRATEAAAIRKLLAKVENAEEAERHARATSEQHERAAHALDEARLDAIKRAERAEAESESRRAEMEKISAALSSKTEALMRSESGYGLQSDGMAAMREQQREAERAAEQAAAAHAERLRVAEAREAELLEVNGQLTEALARVSRSLEEARASAHAAPRLGAELEQLRLASSRDAAARREAEAVAQSAKDKSKALEEALDVAQKQAEEMESEMRRLETKLTQAERAAASVAATVSATSIDAGRKGTGPPNGGAVFATTPAGASAESSSALASQALQLEQLMSERAALRFQLEAESFRRRNLEKALANQMPSSTLAGVRIDVPATGGRRGGSGLPIGGGSRFFSGAVDAHTSRTGKAPHPATIVAAATLDDAIEALDGLASRAGRMLRGAPLARAGVVTYAIGIHVWLFLVPFVQLLSMPNTRAHAHS